MTTLQPDIAAAFDELDRRDKARESEVRADPMVAAAFSTTDPMRMSPERLAKDRARGMGRQPTVPRQEWLESWDDWVDRTYGLTPVVRYGMDTGRRLLRPETGTEVATRNAAVGAARTAIGRRDAGLAGMGRTQVNAPTGDPMAPVVPSTTFLGKSWDSVVSGLETTQDSLNGLAALAYNLDPARRMIAQATGNRMVRQMSDYSRFVAEDVAAASPKSDSFIGQAYYGAVSSLPNLALQVGTSAIAGPAGFIVTGVGADAGSTYAQSTVENTDALLAANPGMDRQTASRIASESATVDAAISGAVSAATNYLPAKVLGTKPELRGLRGFALAKHIGRKASGGAAAEGTQEFTQQVATDMAIAMHRMNQPEFARYFAENPDWWVKVIEDGAMAAMSGAMAGGAVGAGHGAVATLESEVRRSIPVDRKPTPTDAREWVGRVASHEDEVVAGFSRDTAFQRAVGEGLDLGGITTEELAKVAGGDVSAGHTASLLGGLLEGRRFVVTPAMAADEIVRRSGEGKSRIVGGTMAMSGQSPTEDEVADWKARNPEMSARMAAAGSLTRQMAVRILGREFEGNSREFRENLHSMIRSVEPRKSDAELTAERIAADLVGIPADQAMLVLRGLSPESAGIAARIKAEEAAKGPVGGEAVESALSQIASVNGLQREDIAELTELEPDDRAVADFADKRGYKVRFFATRERVPTRGALVDGTIWLSADLSGPEARHAVAIHEIADSIHGSDPRLWGELEAAIRSVAPEALESAGRTYGLRSSEQGGQTLTDADLARESVSTTLEALVEAYSLHLAVGPDGSFDVAKARKLVGENPSAMARFVAAIRSLLRSLGVRLADDAATRRMSQFMGGSPSELSSPNVRAFIAQQLGKALTEHRKAEDTSGITQALAYHGSPHRFDKFDARRIGTGEGQQVYGHGLYFGGRREVAEFYRTHLSRQGFIALARDAYVETDNPDDAVASMRELGLTKEQDELLNALEADDWLGFDYPHQAISAALGPDLRTFAPSERTLRAASSLGALYTVQLAPQEDEYLLWDKPLREQSDKVRAALGIEVFERSPHGSQDAAVRGIRVHGTEIPDTASARRLANHIVNGTDTGSEIYHIAFDGYAKPRSASARLLALGIRGNKYLDGQSRGRGDGSYNYVIFDDGDVTITMTQSLGPPQTETAAFKRWFGDSKVVDKDGMPLVVYHGTDARFTAFKPSTAPGWGRGIYMTDSREHAAEFGRNVMPVYVSIKNPMRDTPDAGRVVKTNAWKRHAERRKITVENEGGRTGYLMRVDEELSESGTLVGDVARELGYDGIIGRNSNGSPGLEIVAFEPTQVKSATANTGAFDPSNADISQSVGGSDNRRNQRRIDLAFQMGRRSGLVAGQVEGQKAARKVTAAEKRAALRKQRDEMVLAARKARTELMDRIRSLRESIALKPTEAAVRRKTTKDIKALLADATKEVERLPKSWRGKFARRLSKATTKARMLRLAEDVAKDLALVPVQALRSDIVRMSRRAGKAKARAETKEVARKAYSDALAMLSSPSGRRMQYTSDADIANRVAAATLLMDSAASALEADALYARSAKVQRATRNAALTAELRKSLLAMSPIKDDGDSTKPPRSALATFVTTPSSDIHTIAHAIEGSGGGAMARIVAGLQHSEEAMNLEKSEVRKAVERAIKPMFGNRHEYDRLAAGVNGDASVRMVPVLLGGKRMRIPLGLALSLAAQDAPSAERMAKVGFVWRTNEKGKPIVPRAAEFDALRSKYGPVVDAVKKAVGDRLADRYFDEYFRLNGQTAPRVDGYYATSRRDDPSADVVDPASIQTGAAVGNALFRQSGDQIARVDSPRPFVIGDFLQTMDRTIDGQLRFIHMAERGREAARVILNADTQTLLDSRFGDGMGESLKLWLLNGLGLSRSHQVGLDAAVSSMSGAMILLNLRTWARQLGGIPKAMTDIDPASLARGVAAASRDIASPSAFRKAVDSVMRNGYFLERWESSQVGRMAGLEGGRKADRARAGAAIRGAFASLAESLRSGATGRIAESGRALGQALAQATLATRAVEWPIRLIDQMVALSVIRGYEASGMSHDQAIAAAAQAFRRTQNPSSRLDDTMLMARAKALGGRWGAAKLLFPFSGDVAKGFNQAARAWRGGTTRERARTFAALAANSAWSAAVNPMFVAAALALKYALGDEDDEAIESANREALAREFGTDLMARAAADLIAYNAGYIGLLGGAVAESIIKGREPDIGELAVPVRLANDIIGAVSSGDPWKAGKSALTAAGVPQVQLVNLAESLNRSVNPDDERAIELLSARKRDGTATKAQLRKLAELTAKRDAAYAKAKAAGEPEDEYQSRRMERDRKRIEARMRQRETLDNEPSP